MKRPSTATNAWLLEADSWCGDFGWCDLVHLHCLAESAEACRVYSVLGICSDSGEICCEIPDGTHDCKNMEHCSGPLMGVALTP